MLNEVETIQTQDEVKTSNLQILCEKVIKITESKYLLLIKNNNIKN